MILVKASVEIKRPVAEVFDFLSDARNEVKWIPGASDVKLVTGEPVRKGSRFQGNYTRAGTVEIELVECARPDHVTFRAHSRIVDFDDEVKLTPTANGTLLEAVMEAQPKGMMRLLSFMMKGVMQTQFGANWLVLKQYLEDPVNL